MESKSAIALALALLLAISGSMKVIDPLESIRAIEQLLRLDLPTRVLLWSLLIGVEFVLAGWLLSGARRRGALFATLAFLGFVTAALVKLMAVGPGVGCGCGLPSLGLEGRSAQWLALTRNLLMIGAALAALRNHGAAVLPPSSGSDRPSRGGAEPLRTRAGERRPA